MPLLRNTSAARASAKEYLDRLSPFGTYREHLASLRNMADPRQIQVSLQIMKIPIIWIPHGEQFYEIAALLLAIFSSDIEDSPNWLAHAIQSQDKELMWRLQLIASRLAQEPGW